MNPPTSEWTLRCGLGGLSDGFNATVLSEENRNDVSGTSLSVKWRGVIVPGNIDIEGGDMAFPAGTSPVRTQGRSAALEGADATSGLSSWES